MKPLLNMSKDGIITITAITEMATIHSHSKNPPAPKSTSPTPINPPTTHTLPAAVLLTTSVTAL